MKYIYTVLGDKIVRFRKETDDYVSKNGEFSFDFPLINPNVSGGVVVESATQDDIDRLDAEPLRLSRSVRSFDGIDLMDKIEDKIDLAVMRGDITEAQGDNIWDQVEGVLNPLKFGRWRVAQARIDAISRPSGQLGTLYDFIKNGIDSYLA